jgi:hypothetical protein
MKELQGEDPDAQFSLLVPRSAESRALTWDEAESTRVAHERADEARRRFEQAGLRVQAARVGEEDPLKAVENEFWDHRDDYDALVVATHPTMLGRFAELIGVGSEGSFNLAERAGEKFGLPVIHVEAAATDS